MENKEKTDKDVCLLIGKRSLLVKMKKNEKDIRFIKSLGYTRWDFSAFCWVVSNNSNNLTQLRNYFGDRLKEESSLEAKDTRTNKYNKCPKPRTIDVIKYRNSRIRIIFPYDRGLISLIKTLAFYSWDESNKWWTAAYTERAMEQITKFCDEKGWNFRFHEDIPDMKKSIRRHSDKSMNMREVPAEYIDKLTMLRYSKNTISIYKSCFHEFINFFSSMELAEISQDDIQRFLLYLVKERKVSTSYQNQSINSIKFYYEKVLRGPRKIYYVERPIKEKTLPVVLSEEEIQKVLSSVNNIKHKCLLTIVR